MAPTQSKLRRYQPEAQPPSYDDAAPPETAPPQAPSRYRSNANPTGGLPDTSGYDFYNQSASRTPISGMPPSSTPYYSGDDIAKQYQNNRNTEQNQGDMFQEYFGGEASRRNGLENAALLKSGQLQNQLEQTPGYSQEEIDAQLGNRADGGNDYRDLLNTDYGSNFLSDDEQSQIKGNPYDPMNQLHPEELTGGNNTAFNASQGYIQGGRDQLYGNYANTQAGLNGAITPDLGMDSGYSGSISNIENVTDDRLQGAANNSGLDMSGEYGRQAGMSDQEVADTAAIGGQAAGARSRAAIQDLERQAAADGNSSPMAVAAMRSQFEDQNAVAGADATVNAQLAARNQQRQAATGVEGTRLGAERYKTGAKIGAAEAMGDLATSAETNREKMRMSGAEDISNRRLGVASQMGQMGQQNAMYGTDADLQNEANWANRGQRAGEFNQTAGYNASRNAEQQQSDRAGGVAVNRQGTNQANQGNQFNRGYQVNATLSNANRGIADARRQGQQENRQYYTGQQQYQGQQGQANNRNMLENRQQTQAGRDQATRGSTAWELGNKNSSFTSNLMKNFGAGIGGGASRGIFGGG